MKIQFLILLLPLVALGYVVQSSGIAYNHRVVVKRINFEKPVISSQKETKYGGSSFVYNYNAAFALDPSNPYEGGLLVRCQNITGDNKYAVGPSVITYTKLSKGLFQLDDIRFDPITADNIVIQPTGPDTTYGTEDPRVVYNPQDKLYYIMFSAVENTTDGSAVSRLALSTTPDMADPSAYTYHGPIFPDVAWSKSGALLIRDSGLSYLYWGDSSLVPGIQLATTSDLLHYTYIDDIFIGTRNDSWDSLLIEAGPMPLELIDGNYFMLYNSARKGVPSDKPNWDIEYNVGYVILDKHDPSKILYRSDKPILSPELLWETGEEPYLGLTPNVVFVEGWVRHPTYYNRFIAFYGGADSVVGAVEISVEF